jgi:Leucine-rich repeat (LRR) protein
MPPNPFENPFRPPPEDLNPDDVEFFLRYTNASEAELAKAGITRPTKEPSETPSDLSGEDITEESATAAEKAAYLNERVSWQGYEVTRADIMSLDTLLKQLNHDRSALGLDPVEFGEGQDNLTVGDVWSDERIQIDRDTGMVKELNLYGTSISSLDKVKLPDGLRELYLQGTPISSLDNVKLPDGLQELYLNDTPISSLDNVKLPDGLQGLGLERTPLAADPGALDQLRAKYPGLKIHPSS